MDTKDLRSRATLALAPTPERAVAVLLRHAGFDRVAGRPAIVAPPPPLPAAVRRLVEAAEAAIGPGATVAYRPRGLASLSALDRRWSDVRLPDGSERFETVRAPAALLAAPVIGLLPVEPGDGIATSPIGTLAAFAHPRHRLVAATARDAALLAELASAIPVQALACAGSSARGGVAFSAPDLVTAQLLWAVLSRRVDSGVVGSEWQVAWERPEVQRAIVLGIGPRRPQEMEIRLAGERTPHADPDGIANRLTSLLGPVAVAPIPG